MMGSKGMKNNVDKLINLERSKRMSLSGENVFAKEVMQDIADYCKVSVEAIKSYKIRRAYPSLPIALKLSEYFRVSVNDIFIIEDYEKLVESYGRRGRKPSLDHEECTYGDCKYDSVAKGLCMNHYQKLRRGTIKKE